MNNFESRDVKVGRDPQTIYRFITDVRNFERFIPKDSVRNWQATKETCNFEIPYAGRSGFNITHINPYSEVNYSGNGFQNIEISLKIIISRETDLSSVVKVSVQAMLNPLLTMIVSKPLELFLEKLANEMETFDDWDKIIE
jgi:hypothetical protein